MSDPVLRSDNRLLSDLQASSPDELRLARCQVDVAFPAGHKTGSRPHCLWYAECNGRPQIIEVKDTGWETYHFQSIQDAQRFMELTREHIVDGSFAGGRLPPRAVVRVQLRGTIDVARDLEIETD
jgi:hypothetical protein